MSNTQSSRSNLDAILEARGLPKVAYLDNTWDRSEGASPVLAVKRGEMGFHPIFTRLTADELNESEGVSFAQREAMHIGSMVGWDIPGAFPSAWERKRAASA